MACALVAGARIRAVRRLHPPRSGLRPALQTAVAPSLLPLDAPAGAGKRRPRQNHGLRPGPRRGRVGGAGDGPAAPRCTSVPPLRRGPSAPHGACRPPFFRGRRARAVLRC